MEMNEIREELGRRHETRLNHSPGLYQALFGSISRKLRQPKVDLAPSISSSQAWILAWASVLAQPSVLPQTLVSA